MSCLAFTSFESGAFRRGVGPGGEFFGILRCARDDGRNLQQQEQLRSSLGAGELEKRVSPLRRAHYYVNGFGRNEDS
jgi:hypothetical protein